VPKNPRQRRIMIALGAAGLLALIVLMQRRGGGAQDAAPAGTLAPAGSTFADNGEQAAELGNTITQGVGDLQLAASDLATTQQGFADEFASLVETLKTPAEPATAVPTAPAALAMTPGNAAPLTQVGGKKSPTFSVVPVKQPPKATPAHIADSRQPVYHAPHITKKHPHRAHSGGGTG
jgi:hypothetical protein